MIHPEKLRAIEERVAEYETIPGFPLGGCTLSKDLAARTDSELAHGWWTGPKNGMHRRQAIEAGLPIRDKEGHFTIRDPESGCYLDISARQFMPELERILILAPDDPRITTIGQTPTPEELYKVGMITRPPKNPLETTIQGVNVYSW